MGFRMGLMDFRGGGQGVALPAIFGSLVCGHAVWPLKLHI